MFNTEPNFDPSLPYGADLVALGIEEPPKHPCDYCGEYSSDLDENDFCEDCSESLSSCCGASYVGETTLCSDCKEYG